MKIGVVSTKRPAHVTPERFVQLQQDFMKSHEMPYLKASDFFLTAREMTDAEKRNSVLAIIRWEDGTYSFARFSWKACGFPFRDQLDSCWGTMFGPVSVQFKHVPDYFGTGKGIWTVEFKPNNILAWRCALMTEEEFNSAAEVVRANQNTKENL